MIFFTCIGDGSQTYLSTRTEPSWKLCSCSMSGTSLSRKKHLFVKRSLYITNTEDSVSQIHQCLLDWEVIRPRASAPNSRSTNSYIHSEPWEVIPSTSSTSPIMDMYNNRPLPSIPSKPSKNTKYPKGKSYDKQRLQLTYAPSAPSFNSGSTTPLENYVLNDQSHERLAMGLDRVPRIYSTPQEATRSREKHHPSSRKGRKDQKDKDSDRDPKRQ